MPHNDPTTSNDETIAQPAVTLALPSGWLEKQVRFEFCRCVRKNSLSCADCDVGAHQQELDEAVLCCNVQRRGEFDSKIFRECTFVHSAFHALQG
jgi:hypothetical protein